MKLEKITRKDELHDLSKSWDVLVSQSQNSVFSKFAFFSEWYAQYEDKINLEILVLKDNQSVVGIAPLINDDGVLKFAGINEGKVSIWDYADFISDTAHNDIFLQSVFQYLQDKQFCLNEIPIHSPTIKYAKEQTDTKILQDSQVSSIPCNNTFEQYKKTLSKGFQKDLDYSIRKIERDFLTTETKIITKDITNFDEILQNCFELHQRAWVSKGETGFFTDDTEGVRITKLHRSLANTLLKENNYILSLLEANGKIISYAQGFLDNNAIYEYSSATDPDYKKWSPGKVLYFKTIQYAFDLGFKKIDFLRGNEKYKSDFGATFEHNQKITNS